MDYVLDKQRLYTQDTHNGSQGNPAIEMGVKKGGTFTSKIPPANQAATLIERSQVLARIDLGRDPEQVFSFQS